MGSNAVTVPEVTHDFGNCNGTKLHLSSLGTVTGTEFLDRGLVTVTQSMTKK